MYNYHFTLILRTWAIPDKAMADALLEAGCKDAVLSERLGVIHLTFDREAKSVSDALESAKADVTRAFRNLVAPLRDIELTSEGAYRLDIIDLPPS